MNCISILIFSFISHTIYALKTVKPKLCIDCKYFIPDDGNGIFGNLFPREENEVYKLVDGNDMNDDYYYCSVVRNYKELCGKEGTFYKKKRVKNIK